MGPGSSFRYPEGQPGDRGDPGPKDPGSLASGGPVASLFAGGEDGYGVQRPKGNLWTGDYGVPDFGSISRFCPPIRGERHGQPSAEGIFLGSGTGILEWHTH